MYSIPWLSLITDELNVTVHEGIIILTELMPQNCLDFFKKTYIESIRLT